MNTLKTLVTLLFVSAAIFAKGQEKSTAQPSCHANTVYFEAFGPGGFYSLNYQHNFNLSKKIALAAGAYVMPYMPMFWNGDGNLQTSVGGQVQVVYRMSSNEIGIGAASGVYRYAWSNEGVAHEVGYRTFGQLTYAHTFHNNLYGGIAFTPLLLADKSSEFGPFGGIRFGYRF